MYNPDIVQIGDTLLYKATDIIGIGINKLTGGAGYSHDAIYKGGNQIIESHLWSGVTTAQIKEEDYEKIDIYRIPGGLTSYQLISRMEWLESKIGYKYGLLDYPATFIHSTIGSIFHIKWLRCCQPIFNNPDTFFCSELDATAYEVAGCWSNKEIHYMNAVPNDMPLVLEKIS